MLESLKMLSNTACRGGRNSEAEGGTGNAVAGTAAVDIGSRQTLETVRTGGAANQPFSYLVRLAMNSIMQSTRRRRNQF